MILAPIVLFVYNRLRHTQRTVDALIGNRLAGDSDLIICADAPRNASQVDKVREVRHFIRTITGFRSVTVIEREVNFGLARSIIEGVTEIVAKYGRIIVLEDDMVTSPYFLTYMNGALEKYADDDRVVSIHGYAYPIVKPLPEVFFLPGADCWGWGTWRRGWACFNPDGQYLLDELRRRKLIHAFNFNGSYNYLAMLEGQIRGINDSWAVRWYASAFLAGKLTLYPGRSLIQNIGNDESGTHCAETSEFEGVLSKVPINLSEIVVAPSKAGLEAFEAFFRRGQSGRRQRVRAVVIASGRKFLKSLAKNWMPPTLLRWMRQIRLGSGGVGIRFDGDFDNWEEAAAQCTGYDAVEILAKVLAATKMVKRGEAAFERDSVLFDEIEYSWPVLAGLLWAAARNGGRLNVLDFGGALGSSFFQNKVFLQSIAEVQWNVVEQLHFVEAGLEHIQDRQLQFYRTIEDCVAVNQPNVILLSSVLQYLESPIEVLEKLQHVGATCLIIDRTPFSNESTNKIVAQRVPSSIYHGSYPMRIFSLSKLMNILKPDWQLTASSLSPEGFTRSTSGIEFSFQSLLFEVRR